MLPIVDADGHLDEEPDEITELLAPPLNTRVLGRSHGLFPKTISFENRASGLLRGHPQSPYRDEPTPDKWLAFADLAGVEQAVLYPTAGIGIGAIQDPEVAAIMARGYNDWAKKKYMDFSERLQCVAILPFQSPVDAVNELRRAHDELGMHGAALPALQYPKPLGAKEYWPIYEEAERLGFFLGVHGTGFVRGAELIREFKRKGTLNHPFCQMAELTSMMTEGVFTTFPNLKIGFLEAGCGWMVYMLDRLDETTSRGHGVKLPSEILRESQIFVTAEPYERTLPLFLQLFGSEHVFCATDFPHENDEEGTAEYVDQWRTMDGLSEIDRRNILSETARRAYSLPVLAAVS